MNLADRLTYLSTIARFPFFGGWIAPSGSNQTISSGNVVMDAISGAPTEDQWLRAYYRKVVGNSCDIAAVDLYVQNIGLSNEICYLRFPSKVPLMGVGLIAKALGDPAPALTIYGAILSATNNSNPAVAGIAETFAPLLSPSGTGIDVTDPATIKGIGYLLSFGVITQDQANLLLTLPLPDFA